MQEKSNWFQKKSKNQGGDVETGTSWRHNNNKRDKGPPTTTLYVPATPDGEMAKRLQEADLRFSDLHQQGWVKIIERGGTKLKDIVSLVLVRSMVTKTEKEYGTMVSVLENQQL